jgi:hypothetical protein
MCGRTHSSWTFRDLFLGHISPISPHFPIRPYSKPRTLSPLPHLNHSLTSKIPQPTATNLLPHHRNTTAGLSPVNPPTAGRPFGQLLIFPPFSTRNPFFLVCSFFFIFSCGFTAQVHSGTVPHCLGLVSWCFCRGLDCFEKGFQTLWILGAHQVFEEIPQPTLTMPRGRGSSSRSTGTQGIVARQPIESRRLILENTFAIKEEFSNNEATSWAVRELKRRGLKRLFKPVAPTAYERLVREFYENLRCECDRLDVLFSSIDGEEVQVTIADIAAALKCNHEPPESDIPWLECPPMLTVEDIVADMCDGHFADDHRNAASKTKIPRNLLFIDMVFYRNVCPLGHKTQRRDLFLSALYAFHRGFWCSIPEIIWRQIQKFWDGVHHRGAEHTKTWGLPFPFLVTHILRKKGIRGNSTDGPITESPYFGPIQWRQSLSHMPRAQPQPQPAPVPEPMDIPEMAAEPEIAAEQEEAARRERGV